MATTTLLTGGIVHRMDGDPRADQALVLRGGRVLASGSAADMRAAAGGDAHVVELGGATVIPGLVDTHPHLMHFGALTEAPVDLSDAWSHQEVVERLRARAAETPPGEWVMGTPVGEPHYFIRRSWRDLAEGELPGREVLDRASREHPIWIQAWAPVTPNVTAFNSAGLRKIGIDRSTPCSVGHVWIDRDDSGEPNGILRGSVNTYYNNEPFWDAILAALPLFDLEQAATGTIKAMGAYNALGVTTVYEGHVMGIDEIDGYRMLRAGDLLKVRVLAAPDAEPYAFPWVERLSDEEFEQRLEQAFEMADTSDDLLRIDGITISRGGPCWPGFMVMREPYRGPYGHLTNGIQFVPASKALRAMEFCAERGLRLNIVAVGDREHDEYLDQLERAARKHDFRRAGWILQHAFFVEEGHARRYADLGFDVTTSMSFSWGKGDLFAERVGERVLADLIPLRRLLDAGMNVSCGSDWGPKNIFEHVALACTHEFAGSGRTNRGAAQEVTREEALAMWTREAAKVLRWEGIGTLAPGAHADLVVVDRDPLACDVDDLPGTQVITTMLGGDAVHDAGLVTA
jgi:predicted amidohydrolase YtcJ